MRARLCIIGSANIDYSFRTRSLPARGATVVGSSFARHFGGKGANQAVAAARLGATVAFIGKLGNDHDGAEYRSQLQAAGIECSSVFVSPTAPTGAAAILVEEGGENSIVVVPGANSELTGEEVKASASVIGDAQFLVAQLEVPLEAVLQGFRTANAERVPTILNPAPACDLPAELLKRCDICTPNESELAALTDLPTGTFEEIEIAARTLRKRGAKEVVVTLGDRGVFLLDGFGTKHLPAQRVQAVDASGAGDVFTAALAVFLAEGNAIRAASRLAQAAAAISVTRTGTQPSFPTRAEVDAFVAGG